MNNSTFTPYLKINQQKITQTQTTTRFTPYKFLNSHSNETENQHIQSIFQVNELKQIQIKNIPDLFQKIKQFQVVMKDSTDKRKALIQDIKISFQKLSLLKQNIMNFSHYLNDNVLSESKSEFKQLKSKQALQSVYTLKQFKKNQFLTFQEKIKRARIICKETEYLNLQLFMQSSSTQKTFYFEQNKKQYETKYDLEKLYQYQKLKKNKVKLRTIYQHEKWTAFTLQAVNFLFRFYKHFKKVTGFYPPKLQKKYIIYNEEENCFIIQPSWAINWILGVIDQPISLQQKFAFKEFPTPTGQGDELLSQQKDSFDITLESQNLNPLIYVNLSDNSSQKNKIQTYETYKNKIQNQDQRNIQKQKQNQKKSNQLQKIMEAIHQISRKKIFTSQSQLLLHKIKNKKNKQIFNVDYEQIDEKVAIYNLLMTIYSLVRLENYDFITNVNNLLKLENKNKLEEQFEEKNKRKRQNQSLSFQQKKILFVSQFLQNKEIQQNVINQMFYYPPQFVINGTGISYFQEMIITQLKNEIPRIQSQPYFYLSMAKNLCHPDCYLMIASNNAIRYIATCLIGQFFKIQRRLMELFFGANYSTFQIDQNSQQSKPSKPSPLEKLSQEQKKKAQQNQTILNILKYKKLSFQKLSLYKESNTQLIENNKVVTSTARTIFRYVQELEKTDFQKKTQNQLKEIQTKITSHLITFFKDFIFNFKMLKYKQLQANYIFRKINLPIPKQKVNKKQSKKQNQQVNNNNNELQLLNKFQVIGFIVQAISLNFSFLKMFNQSSSRSCSKEMNEPQYKITTQMAQIINSTIIIVNGNFIDFSKINTTQLELKKYQKKNEQISTTQISKRIIENNMQLIKLQKQLIEASANIQFCRVKDKNKHKRLVQIGVEKINFLGLNICKSLVQILKSIQKEKPQYLDQLNIWNEYFVKIYEVKRSQLEQQFQKIDKQQKQQEQIKMQSKSIAKEKQNRKIFQKQQQKFSQSSINQKSLERIQIVQDLEQLSSKNQNFSLQQIQINKSSSEENTIKLDSDLQSRAHLYFAIIKNTCYIDSFVFMASFNAIRYIASCMIASLFQIEVLLVEMQKKVKFLKPKVFQQISAFKQKSIDKIQYYKEHRIEMLQNNKVVTTKAKSYVEFIQKNLKDLQKADKQFLLKMQVELGKLIIVFFKDFIFNYKMLKYKQLQIEYQNTQTDLKQLTLQEHIRGYLLEIFFLNFSLIKILNDVEKISKQSYFTDYNLNIKRRIIDSKQKKDIKDDIISIIQMNILHIPIGSLRYIKKMSDDSISTNDGSQNNGQNYLDFQQLRQSTDQDKIAQIKRSILYGCEEIEKLLQKQKFVKKNKDQSHQKNFFSLEFKKNMKEILQKTQKTNPNFLNSLQIWKQQIQNNQDTIKKQDLQQYNKGTSQTFNQKTSSNEIQNLEQEVIIKNLELQRGQSEKQDIKRHIQNISQEKNIKNLNALFLDFMISLTNKQNSFLFLFQNIDRYLFLILFSQLYQKLKQYSKNFNANDNLNNHSLNADFLNENCQKIQKRLKKFRNKAIQKINQIMQDQSYKQILYHLQKENDNSNQKQSKELKQKKHKHRCKFISKQFEIFKFIMKIVNNEQKSNFDAKKNIKILMKYIAKVSETIFFNQSTMKLKSKQIDFQLKKQERNLKKLQGKEKQKKLKNQKVLFIENSINQFRFQMVLLNYQIMNIFFKIEQNFSILDIGLQMFKKEENSLGQFVQKFFKVQNNSFKINTPYEVQNSHLQSKQLSQKKYQEKSISTSPSYSDQLSQKTTIWFKNMSDFCQKIQDPYYTQLLGKILKSLSETQINSQMVMQQQKLDEKKKRKFFGLEIRFSINNYINSHKSLQGLSAFLKV